MTRFYHRRLCASKKIIISTLFLCLLLLASLARQSLAALPIGLQSGDLVFREGDEIISDIIKTVDHSGYSHVGMIYLTAQGAQVIHATPKERADGQSAVMIDSLTVFRAHARNQHIGFYRVNASAQQHAAALQYALQQLGTPFGFTASELYCTQLVVNAWQHAGIAISDGKPGLQVPILNTRVLLPEQLTRTASLIPLPAP